MDTEVNTDRYYLEKEQIPDDFDSDFVYEEVPVDDDFVSVELDEDLDAAVRTIQETSQDELASTKKEVPTPRAVLTQHPEVVDDFVRNFLVKMNMSRTLDCFQTEWYELAQKCLLSLEEVGTVPDVYTQNQKLDAEVVKLQKDVAKFRNAAANARDTYVKLRKERDYHRMHHKRVVQEKNRLITEAKRLKNHYSNYEPTLSELKHKYETAMKEKMLTKLERDRAVGQVAGLQSTLHNIEDIRLGSGRGDMAAADMKAVTRGSAVIMVNQDGRGPTQRALAVERQRQVLTKSSSDVRFPQDTDFPTDAGVNPLLAQSKKACAHLTRPGGFQLTTSYQAHTKSVSSVSIHPRKQVMASTSDDHTWKLWSVPSGHLIMTGEGHTDWLSDCDFHPQGVKLATTSGDTTVKIWDFARAKCEHTFTEHMHAVWSCSWHSCGSFLATASMDNTSKIWDLGSLRCRYTLRGHADSVNAIQYLDYSNTLVTCSADKTVSLWDTRTGLCAQTFYGHMHSVNDVTFNLRGDTLASCDSFGVVKLWDVRTVTAMISVDCGPHPTNKIAFDPTGMLLSLACNDGIVRMYELSTGQIMCLAGHQDAVQAVAFDHHGQFMVSGGSDYTVRIWS